MDGGGDILLLKIPPEEEEEKEQLSLVDSPPKVCDFFNLSSSTRINDSAIEGNEADCSCSSSNHSSTEGESDQVDFPSPDRELDGSGDKDSGVDCSTLSQDSFVSPDKELMERIIKQVEFYFSDENLKKDNFLLKHVCRTKEGNVSLKLVSSFRKVKAITKDWRVVAYSLRFSDKLIVNAEGTKIKRKDPLPEGCKPVKNNANKVNKSVVAFNLPFEKPTMENVAELFAKCGEITLIRILRPGATIPPDIKRAMNNTKHPEIGSSVCAVVEFENQESAAKAVNEMDSKDSDWRALHVVPLMNTTKENAKKESTSPKQQDVDAIAPEKIKKLIKKGKKQDRVEQLRISESGDNMQENEWSPKPRKRSSGSVGNCYPASYAQQPQQQVVERRCSFGNNKTSPGGSPSMSRKEGCSSNVDTGMRPKSNSWGSWAKPGGSPWVQRRMQAARENGGNGGGCGNLRQTSPPDGLVRTPRGPDGTRGFHLSYQMMRGIFVPSPLATVST